MSTQYDRQLSLTVSNFVDGETVAPSTQTTTQSASGTTTNFTEDQGTTIEFGLLTPGSSAVRGGTTPTAGFDIHFNIRRGDISTPNTADIRIYNLNDDTAQAIGTREFRTLSLSAGYPGNFGLIFQGEIKQVRIGRESATDTYVDITAADGDSAYNYSAMALTLAAGSKPADAVQQFVSTMAKNGISQGYIPDLSQSGSVRNRVYYGMTKNLLRRWSQANGCLWSLQNGKLTLIPMQGYIPGAPIILSPQTGLLDTPEQTQNGIECTCLINPQIKIGQLVKLTNTTVNQLRYGLDVGSQGANQYLAKSVKLNAQGLYYVMAIDYIGQTRGQSWDAKLILLAVDAQIPTTAVGRAAIQPSSTAIRLN